jgi:hypothetical protein
MRGRAHAEVYAALQVGATKMQSEDLPHQQLKWRRMVALVNAFVAPKNRLSKSYKIDSTLRIFDVDTGSILRMKYD